MPKTAWSLRLTGMLQMLLLLGVACLVPDNQPWWVYGAVGFVWLLFFLASVELFQGRPFGSRVTLVFHRLLFLAVFVDFAFSIYWILHEPDPDRRAGAIIVRFILPQWILAATCSGLALWWMQRLRNRYAPKPVRRRRRSGRARAGTRAERQEYSDD